MFHFNTVLFSILTFTINTWAQSHFIEETSCFKQLYKAKITNTRTLNGYIKIPYKQKQQSNGEGLYMISAHHSYDCPFPTKPTSQGKSYKSYDLELYLDDPLRPVQISHTVQLKSVDLASTIGRLQRILASKSYAPVKCRRIQQSDQEAKTIVHNVLKNQIALTPKKFEELTKDNTELKKYPSTLSEQMIKAESSCLAIPEVRSVTQRSFKDIPRY